MSRDTELREALATPQPSPKAIAAAWAAWHARHGGQLGPGPAFTEALAAGMAVDHADPARQAAEAQRERDEAREAWGKMSNWHAQEHLRADTALAEATRLQAENEGLRDENRRLRHQIDNSIEARARRVLGDQRVGVDLATGAALNPEAADAQG